MQFHGVCCRIHCAPIVSKRATIHGGPPPRRSLKPRLEQDEKKPDVGQGFPNHLVEACLYSAGITEISPDHVTETANTP